MSGSSGSSTSSGSSSSTLLTLACAWMRSSSEKVRLLRFCRGFVSSDYHSCLEATYSAGVGEEVWANRLNLAVVCIAQLADGLEVLFTSPALRQDRQRQRNLHVCHYAGLSSWVVGETGSERKSEDSRRTSLPKDDLSAMCSLPRPMSLSPEPRRTPERVRIVLLFHGYVFDIPLGECITCLLCMFSLLVHNSASSCSR
jgi:hypothetical protein